MTHPEKEKDREMSTPVPAWKLLEKRPTVESLALQQAIALKKEICPLCGDTQVVHLTMKDPTGKVVKNPQNCLCILYREYWKPMLLDVAPHYQNIKLSKLGPSPIPLLISKEKELATIELLRKEPEKSYIFLGPARTGKTHFCSALYQHALYLRAVDIFLGKISCVNNIWRQSAIDMFEEHRNYIMSKDSDQDNGSVGKAKIPKITVKKIKLASEKGLRPKLFLEEIDKAPMTPFRDSVLFSIVDIVYQCKGQIVISSNLTPSKLESFFQKDEDAKATIIRRLSDDYRGNIVNYFSK